jgi:very-short-patch-repair endonuclease
MNRVNRKHVDFVLCEPQYLKPMIVVELDDGSHEADERMERDALVDQVLLAAQIRIVHVPAAKGYVVNEISKLIQANPATGR